MQLPREKLRAIKFAAPSVPRADRLLQESLGGDPWKVAVASMLLCRTTRRQAEPALQELLASWPEAESLCRADSSVLGRAIRSCGLHNKRARQLIRFSNLYLGDGWNDLRELPGVGPYVYDAVGLVCFGCTELESSDGALVSLKLRLEASRESLKL